LRGEKAHIEAVIRQKKVREHNQRRRPTPIGNNHLTATERESILCLRVQGYGIRKIAGALNRSPSTISRELRRNLVRGAYSAHEVDQL